MFNFTFYNPTEIIFGSDGVERLDELIPKDARVLITYGMGSALKSGLICEIHDVLKGRFMAEFGNIESNPSYEMLMSAQNIIEGHGISFILAVGGGSVIDGSKFISAASSLPSHLDPWEILTSNGSIVKSAIPIGCVLTIPATGSEMNANAVISSSRRHQKLEFYSNLVRPIFSILDPKLTFTLPDRQIANGIVDSLIHVTEQYLTYPVNADVQDKFAEGLISVLIKNAPLVMINHNNYNAMANIMWTSTMALNGIIGVGVPNDWTTHSVGHQITAIYGMDHARTLAIVLPALLRYDIDNKREKLEQLGKNVFGVKTASEAIDELEKFFLSLGVPTCFAEYGIGDDCVDAIANKLIESGYKIFGEKEQFNITDIKIILKKALKPSQVAIDFLPEVLNF